MIAMSFRTAAIVLATGLLACVPREGDPNISDLDGDGIVDAWDQCMADPEDMDGFEDDDGCPEPGSPKSEVKASSVVTHDIKTKEKRIRRSKKGPLAKRSVTARTSSYQGKAWGAQVDLEERAALIFGFGKAWVKTGTKSKRLAGDIYQANFSPDGHHVALVGANAFLIVDVASGKQVGRFSYAKGTANATETKKIRLRANGEILFFDGCNLRRATVGSKSSTILSADHCGDRPLTSEDGGRWFARHEEDEQVAVFELDAQTGNERSVLGGRGEAPGLSLLLASPNGRHLCFSRYKDGSKLTCRDIDAKVATDLLVWDGATDTRATFAADGTLGFGAGKLRTTRDFFSVDLEERSLRKLGSLGPKEEWLNPVGARGFVASGGTQLRHFDVAADLQLDISLGKGEWEGFAHIPGTTGEFIVGKERRATRDLYRVQVP